MKVIKLKNNIEIIVDDSDYEFVSSKSWNLNSSGYLRRTVRCKNNKCGQKTSLLHRELLGYPKGVVDHKNRNKYDNRRENLIITTTSRNLMNKVANRIEYDEKTKQFYPRMRYDKNRISLGGFKDLKTAQYSIEICRDYFFNNILSNYFEILNMLKVRLLKGINTQTKNSINKQIEKLKLYHKEKTALENEKRVDNKRQKVYNKTKYNKNGKK